MFPNPAVDDMTLALENLTLQGDPDLAFPQDMAASVPSSGLTRGSGAPSQAWQQLFTVKAEAE